VIFRLHFSFRTFLFLTSQKIAKILEIRIPPNMPIIGKNAFSHVAGIHQDGTLKNNETYQSFRPKIIGHKGHEIVLGSLSVIYFGVKPRLLMPIMPPLFLLGGEGLVRAYTILRSVPGFQKLPVRASQIAFSLMALILFSPMFARTLLHAHGHFQDKVVMQQAFRWAGSHADKSQAKLITQPYYAGQNADWLRAGWDVWASRRYAGCKIRSLQFPETWKTEPRDWVVINTFWFEGGNLRFDNTRTLAARFDSLKTARQLELKKRFEGQPEPLLLKKLNMLTVYPVDFMEYRPEFEIWGPVEE
jgi:hypothetical protein